MEKSEAKSSAKALYLQAAALAGFEVEPYSAERMSEIIEEFYAKVKPKRRPEAVANLLRLIAHTVQLAGEAGSTRLQESSVDAGREKLCDPPVYPFGK
ncbi:MAG TPA: hypothetical protein VFS60_03420 [Thermoanaerobaculia bacterium]|nr:hypothetical protein [Thermoanaerobaculia bacterium]